jgi:hypothetical protein
MGKTLCPACSKAGRSMVAKRMRSRSSNRPR